MIESFRTHTGTVLFLLSLATWAHASDGVPSTAGTGSATSTAASEGIATSAAPDAPEGLFDRLDRNGDGAIDAEEFRNAMARRFGRLDADSDGRLSGDEIPDNARIATFADADGHLSHEQFQDAVPQVFADVDADGSGTLSLDEMRNARREKQP